MSDILSILFIACSMVGFLNVTKLYRDKSVKGVSLIPSLVFITTNAFEIIYFGRLHDWMPVMGSAAMLVSNIAWLWMAVYYTVRNAIHDPGHLFS